MLRRRGKDKPDSYELAADRIRSTLEPFEPLPEQLRLYNRKRLLGYLVVGLVVAALLHGGLGNGPPAVQGSCTQPAFALNRRDVRELGFLEVSVAGPSGAKAFVTADSTTTDQGRMLGPVVLNDCKATGVFGVTLKAGTHQIRVLLQHPDGTITVLGARPLLVTPGR